MHCLHTSSYCLTCLIFFKIYYYFSNIIFAKSNISEVNFVKLFSLVYCFLRENYVRCLIFPAFATSSLWALILNQQPAVTYDMGKDGEERFRNQEK